MFTNYSIFSFMCTSYIGAFYIHKSPLSCLLPLFWNSVTKKIRNIPKKKMIFYIKFMETKCFMIVISYTCDKVNSYQFYYMNILEVFYFI